MLLVTASESGKGQTELTVKAVKVVEFWTRAFPNLLIRSLLECSVKKGDSPVRENKREMARIQSTVPWIWSKNLGGINTQP